MNSFEINKVFAAVLIALITSMLSRMTADFLIPEHKLAKSVFIIATADEHTGSSETSATDSAANNDPPIELILATANIDNGRKVFNRCVQCHTIETGGPNRVGPNLFGIVGNKMANMSSFAYSSALQEMATAGGVWDLNKLYQFLKNPRSLIAKTKMAFAGIKSAQERADLIAYLNTMSNQPLSLPAVASAAAK